MLDPRDQCQSQTRLDPTTFGAGFVLGCIGLVALLLGGALGVGRPSAAGSKGDQARRWRSPFQLPLVVLIALFLFAARLEEAGTDLPDILTTAAFVALWLYVCLILPIWIGVASWRLLRRVWQWCSAGPYRRGLATGLALVAVLVGGEGWVVLLAADASDAFPTKVENTLDAFDTSSQDPISYALGVLTEVAGPQRLMIPHISRRPS